MLDKIKEIIIEQLNLQGVEITEETSFKDDLGADSLDLSLSWLSKKNSESKCPRMILKISKQLAMLSNF